MQALMRGSVVQRLRLTAGLILFVFVFFHFLNHAVGLIGINEMQAMQEWRRGASRSAIGTLLLTYAFSFHVLLSLYQLTQRTTWRMPWWEGLQIATGLLAPLLLIPHLAYTRFAHENFGVDDLYVYELLKLWPVNGLSFSFLIVLVWVHGCIGVHYWLRLSSIYRRLIPTLLVIAVALPILAIVGFITAGRQVRELASDPDVFNEIKDVTNWPDKAETATIDMLASNGVLSFLSLVLLVLGVYLWRFVRNRAQHRFDIEYLDGPTVRVPAGPTLLETSRINDVPHASVCGGRARCSTCRVRIHKGGDSLPDPDATEARTLASVKAPPDVRLACQIRPSAAMTVSRIVRPAQVAGTSQRRTDGDRRGVERDMVILFLDVRGFTQLSDDKLPYDVVYLLNQFFDAAGAAIREEDGWIDKYLGDGLMAVFGRNDGIETGSAQALRAARRIDLALEALNDTLSSEIPAPLRIGIGIHAGPVVMGEIGYDDTAAMTVIGRTVNAASRLEAMSKEKSCQLVVSDDAAGHAKMLRDGLEKEAVAVRGLAAPLDVYCFKASRDLAFEMTAAEKVRAHMAETAAS